jgi:metal-responsive CopG/Arc/MetJ family transcriptional regulator
MQTFKHNIAKFIANNGTPDSQTSHFTKCRHCIDISQRNETLSLALRSYVKENSNLNLELIQKDGMLTIYEQKLKDLFTKVKQLEIKSK